MIASLQGLDYDKGGALAASGTVDESLLQQLEQLPYYHLPYPKSLANDFGTDVVFPLVQAAGLSVPDSLATYTSHIVRQIAASLQQLITSPAAQSTTGARMLVTGGGACNEFLVASFRDALIPMGVTVDVPAIDIVQYKRGADNGLHGGASLETRKYGTRFCYRRYARFDRRCFVDGARGVSSYAINFWVRCFKTAIASSSLLNMLSILTSRAASLS